MALLVGGSGFAAADVNAFAIANSGGFAAGSTLGMDTTPGSLLYPYTIPGNMGLTKLGPNTLTLTASANTYTGPTQVGGGSLVGTLANIPTAVTLYNGANVTFNQATDATLNYVVSGNGSFTKNGAGVLTLGAAKPTRASPRSTAARSSSAPPSYQPALMHLAMDGAVGPINDGDPVPDASGSGNNATMIGGGASYVAGRAPARLSTSPTANTSKPPRSTTASSASIPCPSG